MCSKEQWKQYHAYELEVNFEGLRQEPGRIAVNTISELQERLQEVLYIVG